MMISRRGEDLILQVDIETPDELSDYKTFAELIAVCVPGLTPMENPDTNAPIYKFNDKVWWIPDYLTNDPLETLRDNNLLIMVSV